MPLTKEAFQEHCRNLHLWGDSSVPTPSLLAEVLELNGILKYFELVEGTSAMEGTVNGQYVWFLAGFETLSYIVTYINGSEISGTCEWTPDREARSLPLAVRMVLIELGLST